MRRPGTRCSTRSSAGPITCAAPPLEVAAGDGGPRAQPAWMGVQPQRSAGRAQPVPTSETVRVAVSKLDALLAHAGELAVTSIRVGQRRADVREIQQQLRDWRR